MIATPSTMERASEVTPFTKKQAKKLAKLVNLNKLVCLLLCGLSVILGL